VVDNRAGAAGALGAEVAAKAPADGYTIWIGQTSNLVIVPALRARLSYDPIRDFAPVSLVATQNLMLVIHPSVPAKSVRELVRFAKAQSGKLSFASAGNGTGSHLSGELFKQLAGVDILHIPYKGVQPAMVDVISGQVAINFPSILTALPHVRSGRVRSLAVTGAARTRAAPELPTMQEAGVKGYESATWYGIVAPAGTPATAVARLNAEINKALALPDVAQQLAVEGATPMPTTAQAFGELIRLEIPRWAEVVKAGNVKPD